MGSLAGKGYPLRFVDAVQVKGKTWAGGDPPAALLLERCLRYAREGAPEGWKGVTVFGEK